MWIHEFVNQKEENQFFCVSRCMFQCNFDRNNRLTEIHTDGIYLSSFKDWPTTLLQNYLARHLTFFSKKKPLVLLSINNCLFPFWFSWCFAENWYQIIVWANSVVPFVLHSCGWLAYIQTFQTELEKDVVYYPLFKSLTVPMCMDRHWGRVAVSRMITRESNRRMVHRDCWVTESRSLCRCNNVDVEKRSTTVAEGGRSKDK